MPEASYGRSSFWLTCITVDPALFGATSTDIQYYFDAVDIESRPTSKPMHLQPAVDGCDARGGAVSEAIFSQGLCLPGGSDLGEDGLQRICDLIRATGSAR